MTIVTATGATRGSALIGQTFSAILKELYLPGVIDLLNSKTILRRRLQRKTISVEGREFILELNTGRNTGFSYISPGGRLPDPGSQTYKQCTYSVRAAYGRIKFEGKAASAARSDRGSFIRVMDSEMAGLARDILHDDNRCMFGDGSGRLAQIAAFSGSTYTLRYPGGIVSTGLGTQYMEESMRVALLPAANEATTGVDSSTAWLNNGAGVVASTITSVDHASQTITVNSAHAGIAIGQWLYKYANTDDAVANADGKSFSRGKEINGLAAIVDDGDPAFQTGATGFWGQGLGKIPAGTNARWRSVVIDNGGTAVPFSPTMFQKGMDQVDINGDGVVSAWYTTHGIRRQYLNTLVANKRFPDSMEMDGGFRVLTWSDRPIFVDKDCTKGRIYGLSEENIFLAEEHEPAWIDNDGSVLSRLDDYDAFQATITLSHQLVTDARNRHVVLADIQDV